MIIMSAMNNNDMTKNLNDWITKFFKDKGLRYLGDVYESGEEIVINGRFLEVREIEFRFKPFWGKVGNNSDTIRLIRFNALSGVHFDELTLIHSTLKEAIETF